MSKSYENRVGKVTGFHLKDVGIELEDGVPCYTFGTLVFTFQIPNWNLILLPGCSNIEKIDDREEQTENKLD